VAKARELIFLGNRSREEWDGIIREGSHMGNTGERISFLSSLFVGLPYRPSTLVGDEKTPESLVIDLGALDCFTFLDYVEAMRRSASFASFRANLIKVRYRKGVIAFENRNHFFSDWPLQNSAHIRDATERIGRAAAVAVGKTLNRKEDGSLYLPGILPVERRVLYIPSEKLDNRIADGLLAGDDAGIYSPEPGLDVSHVGIVIREGDELLFRHASSHPDRGKVCDEPFDEYLKDKPGIVVLRPL
jgi:hypothetical protein